MRIGVVDEDEMGDKWEVHLLVRKLNFPDNVFDNLARFLERCLAV
jgi:hypothetical protein